VIMAKQISKRLAKTRFCKHHLLGHCHYEERCFYAHTREELVPRPDLIKTKICLSFLSGTCVKDDCTYAHGLPELRQPRMMALPDDVAVEPPPPPDMMPHQPHQQLAPYMSQQTLQQTQAMQQGQGELPQYQHLPKSISPLPNSQNSRVTAQQQQAQQQQQQLFPEQHRQTPSEHQSSWCNTVEVAASGASGSDWSLFFELLGATVQLVADEVDPQSQLAMAPTLPWQLAQAGNSNTDLVYGSDSLPLLLELLDQSLQLWIEEVLIFHKTQLPKKESSWALLAGAALRRKRLATCAEGQRLLAIDCSGRMSDSDVPAILCSVLRDPAWAQEFPQLVARCRSFLSTKLAPSPASLPQPSVGTND